MKFGVFNPEEVAGLNQKAKAVEQLEKLGNFWIGPDIALEKKLTIPPLELVRNIGVIVNKTDLPGINITKGALGNLNWSVRSCLAQSGTDIIFHRGNLSDDMVKDIAEGKSVSIPIDVYNNLDRPIELEGNIMRFFWVNDKKRLRHEDLRNVLKSELIIEGEEGKDWSFGDVDFENDIPGVRVLDGVDPKKLKDVCIKLPLKQKFYIPESTEPLNVKSKKDLPCILQPISEGLKEQFQIGETAKVKLSQNIIAVINTGVYQGDKRHIRSPLIDSGFEGTIRTETVRGLEYIELFLYRK